VSLLLPSPSLNFSCPYALLLVVEDEDASCRTSWRLVVVRISNLHIIIWSMHGAHGAHLSLATSSSV
jgi:hypothetical protein